MFASLQAWVAARLCKPPPRATNNPSIQTLDFSRAVGYPLTLHLASWQADTPFAWHSLSEGQCLARGCFLEPPGIGWKMIQKIQSDHQLEGMPESIRAVIHLAPFLGVELAQVCGQIGAARDLAASSPLLLVMLVEGGAFEAWTPDTFTRLLSKKQAELCVEVGLPGTNSCARLLRRCELHPFTRGELKEVKRALKSSRDLALLSHHNPLCLEHLLFMARYNGVRWSGLLGLVDCILESDASSYRRPRPGATTKLQGTLRDTVRMLDDNHRALRSVKTLNDLNNLHDHLVAQLNAADNAAGRATSPVTLLQRYGFYPEPPLPGNACIEPIVNWSGLLQEGCSMKHCVGSYHGAVAAGQVALYHMHDPEAVTVALSPQGSEWKLSEASGTANSRPSTAALRDIQNWLEQVSKGEAVM